tara:strand:- start:5386 stop:5616 length:231 start_codon:yes stop_codon:yes gene_type:complete
MTTNAEISLHFAAQLGAARRRVANAEARLADADGADDLAAAREVLYINMHMLRRLQAARIELSAATAQRKGQGVTP